MSEIKEKRSFVRFQRWFVLGPALFALLIGLIGRERGEMISTGGVPLEGFSGIATLVMVSAFAGFMFGCVCWLVMRALGEASRAKK